MAVKKQFVRFLSTFFFFFSPHINNTFLVPASLLDFFVDKTFLLRRKWKWRPWMAVVESTIPIWKSEIRFESVSHRYLNRGRKSERNEKYNLLTSKDTFLNLYPCQECMIRCMLIQFQIPDRNSKPNSWNNRKICWEYKLQTNKRVGWFQEQPQSNISSIIFKPT